jgi:hypothetical protein
VLPSGTLPNSSRILSQNSAVTGSWQGQAGPGASRWGDPEHAVLVDPDDGPDRLRCLLQADDICAAEPERVTQLLVDDGYAQRYDYALQTVSELPYASWREFDAEDALRLFALRLHEVGMVSSTPNQLIVAGPTGGLKRELKARVTLPEMSALG